MKAAKSCMHNVCHVHCKNLSINFMKLFYLYSLLINYANLCMFLVLCYNSIKLAQEFLIFGSDILHNILNNCTEKKILYHDRCSCILLLCEFLMYFFVFPLFLLYVFCNEICLKYRITINEK